MFDIQSRISALAQWGETLQKSLETPEMEERLLAVERKNRWFIPRFSKLALESWASLLTREALSEWAGAQVDVSDPRKVGIIAAGNIPLVGFHDVLSVLISGHTAVIKPSADDELLLRYMVDGIVASEPRFSERVIWATGRLEGIDAVIATGSNNTSRYFEYYFQSIPSIIRKNRKSVAVLSGRESEAELELMGNDIFTYFGLGCRNVSFLMIPEDFDLDRIFKAIYPYRWVVEHTKYANNYDYHRAILMMNRDEILENGFVVFRESKDLSCPLGTVYYTRYKHLDEVQHQLENWQDRIQVVASNFYEHAQSIPLGQAQKPGLTDYADGVDVLKFLATLH